MAWEKSGIKGERMRKRVRESWIIHSLVQKYSFTLIPALKSNRESFPGTRFNHLEEAFASFDDQSGEAIKITGQQPYKSRRVALLAMNREITANALRNWKISVQIWYFGILVFL